MSIDKSSRKTYIDVVKMVCCIWITLLWHMNEYLLNPRSVENPLGFAITDTVLAIFFFFSGVLTVKDGIYSECYDKKEIRKWIFNRCLRIYPLFFLSLTSIFIAVKLTGSYDISIYQYVLSLLGLGWFYPPQVATLWFVSQLIFYSIITAFVLGFKSIRTRLIVIVSVFCILMILLLFGTDIRMAIFYPAFFSGYIFGKWIFNLNLKSSTHIIGIIGLVLCVGVLYRISLYGNYEEILIPLKLLCFCVTGVAVVYICLIISRIKSMTSCFYYFSYASYCMYLFHRQVYEGFRLINGGNFTLLGSYGVFAVMVVFSSAVQFSYCKIKKYAIK